MTHAGWRVADEWSDEFADEAPIVAETSLSPAQLCAMTHEEVWRHFLPFLPAHFAIATQRALTVSMTPEPVHYFKALLSCRPACGRPIGYMEDSCTFVRGHATCSGCLAATAVREAA